MGREAGWAADCKSPQSADRPEALRTIHRLWQCPVCGPPLRPCRSREAIAVTSLHSPFCMAGMTFFTAISAVLSIPQRTLDIARHHSRKGRGGKTCADQKPAFENLDRRRLVHSWRVQLIATSPPHPTCHDCSRKNRSKPIDTRYRLIQFLPRGTQWII